MSDRMLSIGPDIGGIGIGVYDVDVGLVTGRRQSQPVVTPVAGTYELREKPVSQVVLVVAPVSSSFAEPVAVVEVAVFAGFGFSVHVIQVTLLHEVIPDGRPLTDGHRNGTQDVGLMVPFGGDDRDRRQPSLGSHLLRSGPPGEINGNALGEGVTPLETVLAGDKGEHQMVRQIVAVFGVGLFGKKL